ncbi:MAG TPA: NifU family protein [Rhizomicrobium sp.]|nr:NifU family protein [Rhizomicrobium sp.]
MKGHFSGNAMFIQTESTPNPATLKFLPGRDVMGAGSVADFPSADSAQRSPLAKALFQTPEVSRVFFGADFISVTKRDGDWKHLKPALLGTIMEHFTQDLPLMNGEVAEDEGFKEGDPDIVYQVKYMIDTKVRPAVAQDGGDIIFKGFDIETGIVSLHLQGSCAGCPSSSRTLKNGIENMLRHYFPEVTAVEAV